MNNDYILYRADGTEQKVVPTKLKTQFVGTELRTFVRGSISLLNLGPKRMRDVSSGGYCGFSKNGLCTAEASGGLVREGWCLVVNENGFNEDLPTNEKASQMWGSRLVGDVLLCRLSAIQ